jgi:hypothetical protein
MAHILLTILTINLSLISCISLHEGVGSTTDAGLNSDLVQYSMMYHTDTDQEHPIIHV